MKDPEFSKWLRRELGRKGWSASEFARRVGVRRQTVYKWLNAERLPEPESATRIASVIGEHVDYVLTLAGIRPQVEPVSRFDQERRLREVEGSLKNLGDRPLTAEGVPIPLIGTVPADSVRWTSVGDREGMVHIPEEWVAAHGAPLAAVVVSGDCLLPLGIVDGDIVIVERLELSAVRDGDIVVLRIDDEYTLKQWRVVPGGFELRDGSGNMIRRLTIMDDFEIIGVARHRHGKIRGL